MVDTRDNPRLSQTRNYDEGITYVYLSKLSPKQRKQLNEGMKKSEKGQRQREAMFELRELLGDELMTGASFRLPRDEFEQFMKDGKNEG